MADQSPQSDPNPPAAGTSLNARSALRAEKIAARLALPADAHRVLSTRVVAHLEAFLTDRPSGTIGFCWPIRAEVDCRALVVRLIQRGWLAVMPTVVAVDAPMEFRPWSLETPMVRDPYGIPIPAGGGGEVPDVLLAPLVAFDAAGYRLGYGGGYFDRTLAACRPQPFTIGVGFELGAVATIHPAGHDMPLDAIATETGVRRFVPP